MDDLKPFDLQVYRIIEKYINRYQVPYDRRNTCLVWMAGTISSLELSEGKYGLSRRVTLQHYPLFSFREYLTVSDYQKDPH